MTPLEYFKRIEEEVKKNYEVAGKARAKGLDPATEVEVPVATSLAERVVGLVSVLYPQVNDKNIVSRILELEKLFGPLDPAVALTIAEEVAKEKFCKFKSHLEAMEAGIRIATGYLTLGYVSSPIEGFICLKVKKTHDGKEYLAPYYSGPIRSAGGTEAAFSLVTVDYLREMFGYARYDPTEEEVKRGIQECYEYHERITNLQYLPSEQELEFLLKNCPIQISGDPSEDIEVFNYKDLPRIETNFIRSGFTLVTGEGIAQKAPKILKRVQKLKEKGFKLSDWAWLEEFVKLQKKIKEQKKSDASRGGATYIQDLVGGRPVFAHPSQSGAFRLRYGRCRNTGYSTLALHPATMAVTRGFIAVGTQLKTEKPTKGCTVASCDTIDGPTVLLNDGSVRYLDDFNEATMVAKQIKEVLYLGDILVPYGDFLNRNHNLEKQGYIEQYWAAQLERAGGKSELFPSFKRAVELSREFKIPLHSKCIYYWREISKDQLLSLIDWVAHGRFIEGKLILPYNLGERERFATGKRALELIGCEHTVHIESVILNENHSRALLFNIGVENEERIEEEIDSKSNLVKNLEAPNALEGVKRLCPIEIMDKSGTFIGARMGRPEKAKLRKLAGSPHVLFPVGEEGGRLRSVQEAMERGFVTAEFSIYHCKICGGDSIYPRCERCGGQCTKMYYSRGEDRMYDSQQIEGEHLPGSKEQVINVKEYFDFARKQLRLNAEEVPLIKGVRGTSNKDHSCEHLAKGILRAKHGLNVNKDGTVRYDMTEMPITHFKPCEIGTSVERLREMGYEKDMHGRELERDDQILEIFPHDIILPAAPDSPDEKADEVFLRVAGFIDDELEKFYGLPRFFNAKKREDIVGALLGCMSPHTSATAVGRLIGFSKVQALLASPYIHAAMRRDCLGNGTYVPIKENGSWKITKIGEYIEGINPDKRIDIFGTRGKRMENLATCSNPGEGKVVEVTKHMPQKMLRVRLEDGRILEMTEGHKVYLKGKIERRARELEVGDKLMVGHTRNLEETDIREIFLPEIFKDREDVMIRNISEYLCKFEKLSRHDNFCFRDSFPITFVGEFLKRHGKTLMDLPENATIGIKRDNVCLPLRIPLNNEVLEIIGLYIAEGFSRKKGGEKGLYQVSIAARGELKDFVKSGFLRNFGINPSAENDDSATYSSRLLYELFKEHLGCGDRAVNKRIPSIFLNIKKDKLAALLRGYFEGDGSVSLSDIRVCCDSISEGLKHDLSFVLSRFGIYTKFYEYEKEPGPRVREFYIRKGKSIPKFKITKIIIPSNFVKNFKEIGFISERKQEILDTICNQTPRGMKIEYDGAYAYPKIVGMEEIGEEMSYCFNVAHEHNFFANEILVHNCDGDEAAVMFLMDLLLNFSRSFIPAHRGGTQDAPLVLNMRIRANEVDDMIFDVDVSEDIPLELYEAAREKKHPSEVKMEQVKGRLGGEREFSDLHFSYNSSNINQGQTCSSYKTLPTMQEKVDEMMELCKRIRAVDVADVARLVIERHFIRDTRGNLRKFSMQVFRCVGCNEKFRRPPLGGKCTHCGGRLIFTISEGSILKYMMPSLELARTYNVSPYLLESLELNQMYIESIFGKDKEKQEILGKWF